MSGQSWGAIVHCAVCGTPARTNSQALIEGKVRYVCWQCDDDDWEESDDGSCPSCGGDADASGTCMECGGEVGT